MSTYKHGSFRLSHEGADLNTPSIQWLGIRGQDVLAENGQDEYNDLLRLSARDRNKAVAMLENDVLQEGGKEEEWRRELQVMLMLNVKAEMEVLDERGLGVKGWVEEKLLENGISLHADEDLHEIHQLANMTLGEDDLPGLRGNEESLLDVHEPSEISVAREGSPNLQPDEDLHDTHQTAETLLAEEDLFISLMDGDLLEEDEDLLEEPDEELDEEL